MKLMGETCHKVNTTVAGLNSNYTIKIKGPFVTTCKVECSMATHPHHTIRYFIFENQLVRTHTALKRNHAVAILYPSLCLLSTSLLEGCVCEGMSIMSQHQH